MSSDAGTPSAISSLLLEYDIALPPDRNSVVVDHFNYDTSSASEKHDVLLVPRENQQRKDVTNFFGGGGVLAVPQAVAQTLGNTSPLLTPVLKASASAYAYNPKEEAESMEDPFATGSQLSLISAMQARNSARFTVLGSLEMLQDKWFTASVKGADGKAKKTANRDFAKQLSEWTFKEVGVLRVNSITHHLVDDASKPVDNTTQIGFLNPTIYRIKNDVVRLISASSQSSPLIMPDLLHHHLSIHKRPLGSFHSPFLRRPATRIQHALSFRTASTSTHILQHQQHHILHNLYNTRPTWHLRF